VASVTVTQGPQPVKADFAGDGYYLPSADATKNVIIDALEHPAQPRGMGDRVPQPRHLRPR